MIASGLARGIDAARIEERSARLQAARSASWACGIDVVYPKENKKIFDEIEKRGAIISEFPMGTFPAPQNFPMRNRIIAGMALGVVVVEGAQYSGSLITARLAMEFGREVYGVPGNATQPSSFGPNQLIKQGAKLVTGWEDVVEELPTPVRAELLPVEATTAEERSVAVRGSTGPDGASNLRASDAMRSRHVDDLVETSGLSSSEVLAALFDLELQRRGTPVTWQAIPESPVVISERTTG